MARIPYADIGSEEARPLVERITKERGSVLHLYQMLLHSPPIAEGWLNYLTAVRQKSSLNGAIRELVIVRIAQINGAPYEAEQHIPIALKEGITQQQIDDLETWQTSDSFNEVERRVLGLAEEMTRNVQVDKKLVQDLSGDFSHTELVELVATIGAYNMVSRFLEAFDIHSDDAR
ncbi:carboxymuconolactone decarboxylase family protein [Pusillimonas sp. ANT_WB101]|uniref:carboxymuconolactone decarboxylase family protein n=1 Tax=Pusillimonas sp. ANT_WB101 TaxID=2597356 RepID=UPI0011EC1BA4|nr:carboxymuconolactone decarboxylase family protein [Pusillimonas sp. ANT_WB101]KAA0911287.1 carboxymuconolactone decarboxylase family protein [Pusillimonas sp. ANT_WB101]NYT76968.1 carboxymuconolactone decarboxylase family protein [Alcaligenaceae bacterium]